MKILSTIALMSAFFHSSGHAAAPWDLDSTYVRKFCHSQSIRNSFYYLFMQDVDGNYDNTGFNRKELYEEVNKEIIKDIDLACENGKSKFSITNRIFQTCKSSCQMNAPKYNKNNFIQSNLQNILSRCISTCNQMDSVQGAYMNGFEDGKSSGECRNSAFESTNRETKDILKRFEAPSGMASKKPVVNSAN